MPSHHLDSSSNWKVVGLVIQSSKDPIKFQRLAAFRVESKRSKMQFWKFWAWRVRRRSWISLMQRSEEKMGKNWPPPLNLICLSSSSSRFFLKKSSPPSWSRCSQRHWAETGTGTDGWLVVISNEVHLTGPWLVAGGGGSGKTVGSWYNNTTYIYGIGIIGTLLCTFHWAVGDDDC